MLKAVIGGSALLAFAYFICKGCSNKRIKGWWKNCLKSLESIPDDEDGEKYWNTALFFPNYFPEKDDSETLRLIWFLQQATDTLDVCLYSLNFGMLENALVRIRQKGVVVRILSNRQMRGLHFRNVGIQLRFKKHCYRNPKCPSMYMDLLHHKFAVVDDLAVITGSLNWTRSGISENKENVAVTTNETIIKKYANEFQRLWDESANVFEVPEGGQC